jgi:hypothetical protein
MKKDDKIQHKDWQPRISLKREVIEKWSQQYAYDGETDVIEAGSRAKKRGYYTQTEFLSVCDWKSRRTKWLSRENSPRAIEDATKIALAAEDPVDAVVALMKLSGVGIPVASALLHLAGNEYPLIDFRALWTMRPRDARVSLSLWSDYVLFCRAIARSIGVKMRILDRALWAYSKKHQPNVRKERLRSCD